MGKGRRNRQRARAPPPVNTQNAPSSVHTQNASPSINTQNASLSVNTQNAPTSIHTQNASSSINTQNAPPSVHTQNASSLINSQNASLSVNTHNAPPSVHTQNASSSINTQNAPPSVHTQNASSPINTQNASLSVHTQNASSSVHTQNASSSINTQNASPSVPTQNAYSSVNTTSKGSSPKHNSKNKTAVTDFSIVKEQNVAAEEEVKNVSGAESAETSIKKREPNNFRNSSSTIKVSGGTTATSKVKRDLKIPNQLCLGKNKNKLTKAVGTIGKNIPLRVNHFDMTVNVPGGYLYHYDVTFKLPWKREVKNTDRPLLMKCIELFKTKFLPNPNAVVFDGKKNIYTCEPLQLSAKDYTVNVDYAQKDVSLKVELKHVGSIPVNADLAQYKINGTTENKPYNAIQAMNIILGMTSQLQYETIGRKWFDTSRNGCAKDIGGGMSVWVGTFMSVRFGWKPMLNVDVANKVAFDQSQVIDFIKKVFNGRLKPNQLDLKEPRNFKIFENVISRLRVLFKRPDGFVREYRVVKLMPPASTLKFNLENGEVTTVAKYFETQYEYKLKYPNYPCLHVGSQDKSIYLPIELCVLKKQFAPASKRLNEREAQEMIKQTAVPPVQRKKLIETNIQHMNDHFSKDKFAKAFGISVSGKMPLINGRVLTTPIIKYSKNGSIKSPSDAVEFTVKSGVGKWSMLQDHKLVDARQLNSWGLLNFGEIPDTMLKIFIDNLHFMGRKLGMNIFPPCHVLNGSPHNTMDMKRKFTSMCENKNALQMIIVICGWKTDNLKGQLKWIGDVQFGLASQLIIKKNVMGRDNNGANPQVLHNVCLKINAKLGGVNHSLSKRPNFLNHPVMLLGGDVTHAAHGDVHDKPSIAAVVASTDCHITQYYAEVRLQEGGQAVEEIVKMEEMVYNLLLKFREANNGRDPYNIMYYRDGVSEGQFSQILNLELSAIRRACTKLSTNYEPHVTFIVAQKRHQTRLFVEKQADGIGRTKNVPSGTIVDTEITTPFEEDFFLASHEGIQGTTRPTHYHVLWNDGNLSPDELQMLTYSLCHLYARCERSVSYPAPTYYAHLAAFRAREHHNALLANVKNKHAKYDRKEGEKRMERIELKNYFI